MISEPLRGLLEIDVWQLVKGSGTVSLTVMGVLLMFSLNSITIIFAKFATLRRARNGNARFLRTFRKATRLDAVAAATEQFRSAPLATVFDFGYSEVARQLQARGKITNIPALERTLQLGMSEEMSRLERSMNWLATTATVTPFIGLFGTVLGIIDAFLQARPQAMRPACAPLVLASRRRWEPRRWACWRRFRRRFSITFSATGLKRSVRGWRIFHSNS